MDAHLGLVLSIGMDVACSDGRVGRLERVLFDPSTHRLVFLVVAAGGFPHEDVLVALAQVGAATGDSIVLNVTRAQFAQLCDCVASEELEAVPARSRRGEVRAVGPAQAIERGTQVRCIYGLAGRVEAVRIDPVSGEIQGLVVREQGLFAADRIVPAMWIVVAHPPRSCSRCHWPWCGVSPSSGPISRSWKTCTPPWKPTIKSGHWAWIASTWSSRAVV